MRIFHVSAFASCSPSGHAPARAIGTMPVAAAKQRSLFAHQAGRRGSSRAASTTITAADGVRHRLGSWPSDIGASNWS